MEKVIEIQNEVKELKDALSEIVKSQKLIEQNQIAFASDIKKAGENIKRLTEIMTNLTDNSVEFALLKKEVDSLKEFQESIEKNKNKLLVTVITSAVIAIFSAVFISKG